MRDSGKWRIIATRLRAPRRAWVAAGSYLLVGLLLAPLLGCGKRGAPSPPGPPSQITYPKIYPTQ